MSEIEVLDFLASNGGWTLGSQITKKTKMSRGKMYRQLKFLQKINEVETAPAREVMERLDSPRGQMAYRLRA